MRVQINHIDDYQAPPSRYDPQLHNETGPRVPVVRIFGVMDDGWTVCAHVHGAFPYLYIEYPGDEDVNAFIYRLHVSIDHALAVSYRHKNPSASRMVARITLVKAAPFYGFHVGYRRFLKIYTYTPSVLPRLAELLQQGVVLRQSFQPYEAHIGHVLQFMVDYNLYGCGWLETEVWEERPDNGLPRTSHSQVEIDICAHHVLNRREVVERRCGERGVRLVPSLRALWGSTSSGTMSTDISAGMSTDNLGSVQTAFASVDDLYPARLRALGMVEHRGDPSSIDVDEDRTHGVWGDSGHDSDGEDSVGPSQDPLSRALEGEEEEDEEEDEDVDVDNKTKRACSQPAPEPKRARISTTELYATQPAANAVLSASFAALFSSSFSSSLPSSLPLTTTKTYSYAIPPPSSEGVAASFEPAGLPDVIYPQVHYGRERDVPRMPWEYAGREVWVGGVTVPFLAEFGDSAADNPRTRGWRDRERAVRERTKKCLFRSWEFAAPPPSWEEVIKSTSNITKPTKTISNTPKITTNTTTPTGDFFLSIMTAEVHINTRGTLLPDPAIDAVQAVFWAFEGSGIVSGIVVNTGVDDGHNDEGMPPQIHRMAPDMLILGESSELDLLIRVAEIVRSHDPDILAGYEMRAASWGFLLDRARLRYDYDMAADLGRATQYSTPLSAASTTTTSKSTSIIGRHMLTIWRALRAELHLAQYSFEHAAWHVLGRRVPEYSHATLTQWWVRRHPRDLHRLVRYHASRTRASLSLLSATNLIARTAEQARIVGIDFSEVYSRGSQLKVESVLFRIAKAESFIMISPSRRQVASQRAPECLPLVMEPASAFYTSPVVVLDFESLYPSIMVAYNYCYSTCCGSSNPPTLGFTKYSPPNASYPKKRSPNGAVYVPPDTRRSLLADMLAELLETRVMVKNALKSASPDVARQLDMRQCALKLLANVTYGYAAASMSGRMPCAELADSIVQTGRETLERAIALVHAGAEIGGPWPGAHVVYGDTDSLFIHLPGRTRVQAFDLGHAMAAAVTASNPRPVRLRLDKVYHPCVLLAKKRYVGYKYESPESTTPIFEAKGTETVRRDGTRAQQDIEERALRILFDSADLSAVKAYFVGQCERIMRGVEDISDFCFWREVKLGTYSTNLGSTTTVPGVVVSARRMRSDPRAEPLYGQRVPYLVVAGAPGASLVDRCVSPEEYLASLNHKHRQRLRLDANYYITRHIIPPLERIFNLVGVKVRTWYNDMPKVVRGGGLAGFITGGCVVCGNKPRSRNRNRPWVGGRTVVCPLCASTKNAHITGLTLASRVAREERHFADLMKVCLSCEGSSSLGPDVEDLGSVCKSIDCPVYWARMRRKGAVNGARAVYDDVLGGHGWDP